MLAPVLICIFTVALVFLAYMGICFQVLHVFRVHADIVHASSIEAKCLIVVLRVK